MSNEQPIIDLSALPKHLIPPKLQEIAEYCGKGIAIKILMHFPGVHLHIPKFPHIQHRLMEILGLRDFTLLCQKYGNETLMIPRAAAALRHFRNQKILADFTAGKSQASIAIEHGMTERQINTICNRIPCHSQNVDLFDCEVLRMLSHEPDY